MGWGEARKLPNDGAGSLGTIELAQLALDRIGIPNGTLADRVLTLVGRLAKEADND